MTYNKIKKTLLFGALTVSILCGAQTTDKYQYYKEKFSKKGSVILSNTERYIIQVNKNGELDINRYYEEDVLLIGKFSGGWNEDAVYFTEFEEIHDLKASTFVPNGTKYKEKKIKYFRTEKLVSNNVFQDGVSAIFFEYPDISPGCRKKHSYREHILNSRFLPPIYFQHSSFTESMKVELIVPDEVNVEVLKFNLENAEVNHTTVVKKGYSVHTWTLENIDAYESESMAPSAAYFVPHIAFVISDYTFNGEKKNVLGGVEDLRGYYISLLDSVNPQISSEMQEVIDSVTLENVEPLEKAKQYYDWVRNNIKYIAVEDGFSGFIPDDPSEVTSKKYGDCKGMSCLLSNLMRYDDFEIYETWIGTRKKPYSYNEYYTPYVDNHMISAFNYNGEWIFLDATDPYIPFGYPSSFIQGKEAMINKPGEKATLVTVPIMAPEDNYTHSVDTLFIEGEQINGVANTIYGGYKSAFFKARHYNATDPFKFHQFLLEKGNNKFELGKDPEIVIKDTTVNINYTYKLPHIVRNLDDKVYINLNLNKPIAEEALDKDRKYPIEFDDQQLWTISEYLVIPEGKTASFVPEDFHYNDSVFEVDITYNVTDEFVIYKLTFRNTGLMQPASYGATWNNLVKKLRIQYRQTIELTNN